MQCYHNNKGLQYIVSLIGSKTSDQIFELWPRKEQRWLYTAKISLWICRHRRWEAQTHKTLLSLSYLWAELLCTNMKTHTCWASQRSCCKMCCFMGQIVTQFRAWNFFMFRNSYRFVFIVSADNWHRIVLWISSLRPFFSSLWSLFDCSLSSFLSFFLSPSVPFTALSYCLCPSLHPPLCHLKHSTTLCLTPPHNVKSDTHTHTHTHKQWS